MKDKYTTAEIADVLGVSVRTIQRHLATLRDTLSQDNKTFDYKVLNMLETFFDYKKGDTQTTKSDNQETEYDRTEFFSEEEYQEFQKRLIEYPMLLDKIDMLINDLEYHKKLLEINLKNHNDLISTIKERNFIEAKEKNLDK